MRRPRFGQARIDCPYSRRDFLRRGLYGLGVTAGLPMVLNRTSAALAAQALGGSAEQHPQRILVVVELSGGNDGLNTVVPFGDDAYYRARPKLGIPRNDLLPITDGVGLHPSLVGFERLYKDGLLAVVEGCGYPNPSLSHFTSMGFWHTGVPNGGETLGWVGRFADAHTPDGKRNLIVNIANSQSLAVRGRVNSPLVFNDPGRFQRQGEEDEIAALARLSGAHATGNSELEFLRGTAENAIESSAFVRQAWSGYQTPVDYGIGGADLRKVAALIAADMPTRVYYVSFSGNSFDTHVHQADLHARLLMYMSDAVRGFMEDVQRLGRADDVAMVLFSEFGRRVEENASLGTDHGTAGPMFVVGKNLEGGFYGKTPSLTDLDDGNLEMTTDFRRVYATVIDEWMGYSNTEAILKGDYQPLGVFSASRA
ncbi:MAG TPA: DUF1501 domain-containing protein [Acidobacteriota bacterium]|nr:DUF1501 domain-containing protein [Acidobacteriota bacterium]